MGRASSLHTGFMDSHSKFSTCMYKSRFVVESKMCMQNSCARVGQKLDACRFLLQGKAKMAIA